MIFLEVEQRTPERFIPVVEKDNFKTMELLLKEIINSFYLIVCSATRPRIKSYSCIVM